jgi:hypothetical protein
MPTELLSPLGRRQLDVSRDVWMADQRIPLRFTVLFLLAMPLLLILSGCAYRLPPYLPPSQERIRVAASAPEHYVLTADFGGATTYNVPHDGRVLIGVPGYRTCGVYLFNAVKIRGENQPLSDWSVALLRNGKVVRKLSLNRVRELPIDQADYHVLSVPK